MKTFLLRIGDGNEGNFPVGLIDLDDTQDAYAALAACVANRWMPGARNRRHAIKHIEIDGEEEFGIDVAVNEGPDGEQAFGAAWLTAQFEPVPLIEDAYYKRYSRYTLKAYLDSAAWRYYLKESKR